MADKTIAQLAGLNGDAVSPDDLLPVWDASGNATKSVSIEGLKQAIDLATGTSTLALAALDENNDAAEFRFNAKPLLKVGSSYALSTQSLSTPSANSALYNNSVALYNPKGALHLHAARSDTAAAGAAGTSIVFGGMAAAGSNLSGGGAQLNGGLGDSTGAGGGAAVVGGNGGLTGHGGAVSITGGRPGWDQANGTFNNGTGNGGGVAIRGGVGGAVGGNGGNVSMTAGNGTAAGSAGGQASLTAGNGVAAGGSIYLKAGGGATLGQFYWQIGDETVARVYRSAPGAYVIDVPAPSSATSTGHLLSLQAGYGGTTAGSGGWLYLNGGPALADGNGGSVVIQGRDAAGTDRNGGSVTITSGAATGTGTVGNVSLSTPAGGTVSMASGDSSLAIADPGSNARATLRIDGKDLLKLGSIYAIGSSAQRTPPADDADTQNSVHLYNPRGQIWIQGGRSDTRASGATGSVRLEGGHAAAGSNGTGHDVMLHGGAGDGTGSNGAVILHGGAIGIIGSAANGANGDGGGVYIESGEATGTGTPGNITLWPAGYIVFPGGLTNAADDTAAASAGVPVNGLYRNGSALMLRVA
ncbi:hypothetical protein [Azospirillum sp. TSO22-1]|uniref:hypothetical protein n=1 Tax=Azospirillum sp. TSO22-1 TaxID=716789 RepID=UPI000D620A4B|nr:hypothetical protein [Azospirillum sp. TSO22-1]PWC44267.1 hypothetical protein TSO221_18410 [Azospirillum sp. TSO22-1]